MKSAEEFVRDGDWRSYETAIQTIKARDLEMWKKGMTDAANGDETLTPNQVRTIQIKRDRTESV